MTVDDRPTCLICGKRFRSVGHHVVKAHDMSLNDYRDRHGIRRGAPLTCGSSRARWQATMERRIGAGELAEVYATNAARIPAASEASARTWSELRALGARPAGGKPETPRAVLEAIVAEIESGAKMWTAVRRSTICYATLHAGLIRHPDLRARVDAAKALRRKN